MFNNFIKSTFRNIAAHKSYTAINILGLTVGIASTLLIGIYIFQEFSYDKFHRSADDIYRISVNGEVNEIKFNSAMTSGLLPKAIYSDIPEVELSTRIVKFGEWLVENDSVRFNENRLYFVDTNFFRLFNGFKIIKGDPVSMFANPHSIVLTKSAAIKYFGKTDIVGKYLKIEANKNEYLITGVVEDTPENSHFKFDILASLITYEKSQLFWTTNNTYNYIKISDNAQLSHIESELNAIVSRYVMKSMAETFGGLFSHNDRYVFGLQPLTKIHLHSNLQSELEPNGQAIYVYIFGVVAILILIIACLNFVNMTSAYWSRRINEVVIRISSGADRWMLASQFLIENIIISFIALCFAIILSEAIMPLFNSFLNVNINFVRSFNSFSLYLVLLVFALVIGILLGIYPAIKISLLKSSRIIYNNGINAFGKDRFRKSLVIFQFFISTLIILSSLAIYAQIKYMMQKDLGFDKDYMLVINRSDGLKNKIDDFKEDLLKDPNIIAVSNTNKLPGRNYYNSTFKISNTEGKSAFLLYQTHVGFDYYHTLGLEIVQGRFFDPAEPSDSFACVINEAAAREFGLSYPLGTVLEQPSLLNEISTKYKIIGVVKDFNYQSLDNPVNPLVICFMPGNWEGYILVKLESIYLNESISYIGKTWRDYTSEYPFSYFFLDQDLNLNYLPFLRLGRIFIVSSLLAVFFACLGLVSFLSYISNFRFREIGIRRAVGANISDIVTMLIKETLMRLMVSIVIAWVSGYFLLKIIFKEFVYHIPIRPYFFIISAGIVLVISLVIVLYKTYKAAISEPGMALKYE